uniref:Uncharacterized protein n=1 Tax=Rhizophora mucronata TaxID=61149 RepID=A0A2P2P8A1_RHIMU
MFYQQGSICIQSYSKKNSILLGNHRIKDFVTERYYILFSLQGS